MRQRWLIGIGLGLLLLLHPGPVNAQASATKLTVSPFLQQVQILGFEPTENVIVKITNNTDKKVTLHLTALDFGTLDNTGGLVFAGSNESVLLKKYGLASWLDLPTSQITLNANQTLPVRAVIRNESTLAPGGHYAAIVASVVSGNNRGGMVSVNQKISALVLATKIGGETYDLSLPKITSDAGLFSMPHQVILQFKNTGNVHVAPRGLIKVIGPGGRVVAQGAINEASGFVLPERARDMLVELHAVSHKAWYPASYRLEVDYRYDGISRYATHVKSFFYLNFGELFTALLVLSAAMYTIQVRYHLFNKQNYLRIIKELRKITHQTP